MSVTSPPLLRSVKWRDLTVKRSFSVKLVFFCLLWMLTVRVMTEHMTLTENLLSFLSLAVEDHHPLPKTSPPSIILLFFFPSSLSSLYLIFIFSPKKTKSPAISLPWTLFELYYGTLHTLFIFARVLGSDTWSVWTLEQYRQPQIRNKHTVHED